MCRKIEGVHWLIDGPSLKYQQPNNSKEKGKTSNPVQIVTVQYWNPGSPYQSAQLSSTHNVHGNTLLIVDKGIRQTAKNRDFKVVKSVNCVSVRWSFVLSYQSVIEWSYHRGKRACWGNRSLQHHRWAKSMRWSSKTRRWGEWSVRSTVH